MAREGSRTRGASLLEVLIATGLSAMLLAIAVPNLRSLQAPFALRAATDQIVAGLQAARMRAIARNARYRVTFDPSAGTYSLDVETGGNFVTDGGVQQLPRSTTLGTIAPGNPIFSTQGTLASAVTIPVSATAGRNRTISVNVLGQTTVN
jgi:type II secretory pathway pseudopilin PulG